MSTYRWVVECGADEVEFRRNVDSCDWFERVVADVFDNDAENEFRLVAERVDWSRTGKQPNEQSINITTVANRINWNPSTEHRTPEQSNQTIVAMETTKSKQSISVILVTDKTAVE